MNWLDIVILVILAGSLLGGLLIGFIKTALSLAGVIIGVILAGRLYLPLAERLSFIHQTSLAKGVAFAAILILTMLVAALLAFILKKAVSALLLGWVNRIGGAVFGLVLGAIFCGALLAVWVKFFNEAEFIKQSKLAVILLDRFPAILALLPSEFGTIRSFFQ